MRYPLWGGVFILTLLATVTAFGQTLVERILFAAAASSRSRTDGEDAPAHESVTLTTSDGVLINAWYFGNPHARNVILYNHGNGGNVYHWSARAADLCRRFPVSVLMYDYRGYGKSGGSPTIAGIRMDARAARDWLCQRTGRKPNELVYYGRSLGGGVAVDLAAETGAQGLVVESSFSSIRDMVRQLTPWLPVSTHWLVRTDLDSLENIQRYDGPLLQSHGDADSLIPLEQASRLFEAAKDPKQFVIIPNGNHNSPQTEAFFEALGTFLEKIAADQTTAATGTNTTSQNDSNRTHP